MKEIRNFFSFFITVIVFLLGIGGVITPFFILVGGVYYYFNDNKVIVKVENKKIYQGVRACLKVRNAGSATSIAIMKPFLWCQLFTKATYVSSNITITPTN